MAKIMGAGVSGKSQLWRGMIMNKATVVAILCMCLSFTAGLAVAQKVHDWHDLDAVHTHVLEAIHEMETARAANHYDMAGHGAKAEEHLRAAEHELHEAIEASRAAH
jgi:hypothetical protein